MQKLLSFTWIGCQVDSQSIRGLKENLLSFKGKLVSCMVALGMFCIPDLALAQTEVELPARAPLGLVWSAEVSSETEYSSAVKTLLSRYESTVEAKLRPGERGKVGLKVNTRGGRGLSTPLPLLSSLIQELADRGFTRESIMIVDYSAHSMRQAGILPALSAEVGRFEGCPVIALDTERYYDADWFYDSPLPPALRQEPQLFADVARSSGLKEGMEERKSFLPAPLLFEVDFWFNLAVAVDDPSIGIDGALANSTLWSVSNSQRFLVNPATASAAIAEIAAIPELEERLVLNFISLVRYQFIGGPRFNSIYTRSEPYLWMGSDPVAIDRLLYDKMNAHRLLEGFPEIQPLPRQLPFAASLGLGYADTDRIRVVSVQPDKVDESGAVGISPAER